MNENKQIVEIKECIDAVYGADCAYFDVDGFAIANEIYKKGFCKSSEVAREFRQRMNKKMGKHTHLLGKEYVQRIMREIEKEFSEVENG